MKIISSCVFVMMLQVQIGGNSLEFWIERSLQTSYFGQKLRKKVILGQKLVSQKLGIFESSEPSTKDLPRYSNQSEEYLTEAELESEEDGYREPSAITR